MRSAAVAVAFLLTSGGPVLRARPAVQPLTAGAVVLSAGKSDPVSVETLKRGLRDADPAVRITAARVATVTDGPGLANDILAALAREQRPKIAAEMIRALLVHAGEAALPAVDAQLSRIGNDAFPVTAEWMARMKPDGHAAGSSIRWPSRCCSIPIAARPCSGPGWPSHRPTSGRAS
jgi:hypothetical protein